jgi:hypothetical protein
MFLLNDNRWTVNFKSKKIFLSCDYFEEQMLICVVHSAVLPIGCVYLSR